MIRRGDVPGISAYFEKSVTPLVRRKSSSSSKLPFTSLAGLLIIARIASEKMAWIIVRTHENVEYILHAYRMS
jgi:hypothetical protein